MAEQTPEEINEIKNAVKPFTPGEIAEEKARRDAIWAAETVEVVAEAEVEAEEPAAGITQGAQGTPETEVKGESRRAKPKPK